ncbi:MAG: cation:proton antiporter [Rikenellaceae bacterium]
MLVSIAYLSLLALLLGSICVKLRLPALVGMLLSGIILGPYCLNLLSPELLSISVELRQIALVIILMRAGLALDIEALKKVGRPALMLCFVPACFEIVAMIVIAPILIDISVLEAAIMGTVVAAVSPAVIVPKMLKMVEEGVGTKKGIPQMIMAGGSVDDVFVIVLFTAFVALGQGGEFHPSTLMQVPISIVLGLVVGFLGGYVLVKLFKAVHLRDTVKLLILLSVAFLFLGLEAQLKGVVPISGLLAVMAMGATVLSKYEILAKRISPKYSKLWVFAEILLFVLVGATVNINFAIAAGPVVLLILAFVLIWRMVGVYCSMVGSELNFRERLFCMIAYMPKATVQAAIGSIPLSLGLGCGEIVLTMAVVAILVTAPLGAFGIDLTMDRLLSKK